MRLQGKMDRSLGWLHIYLTSAFATCGYPLSFLQYQIFHMPPPIQLNINSLSPSPPLITTYHPGLQVLKHTLKESHYILLSNPSTLRLLTCPPQLLSICQFLVKTKFSPRPSPQSIPVKRSCDKTGSIPPSSPSFTNVPIPSKSSQLLFQ